MDHHLVLVLLLLWSSGFQAEGKLGPTEPDDVRLVGGDSRCAGSLELKHEGEWRPVDDLDWTLKAAAVFCKELDCGSAVSVERKKSSDRSVWRIRPDCVQSGSALRECTTTSSSIYILTLTCSDSVRLLNGTSLCSGRLKVRSDQSGQRWSSVCEADFDQQDAEVVCRELGCGAPSVLQEALYGDMEAPMWPREFQCGGNESALLDCRRSDSARKSCSPGKTVGLTCLEPDDVRLVGGDSRCAGSLELKHEGEWRPVDNSDWTPKAAAVICKELDCGSAVSVERKESSVRSMWRIRPDCVQSGSALRDCTTSSSFFYILTLTCSDSVRLLNGTSLCSGRLEVRSDQSGQHWSSVCEADFDQQDAEVVCRELGCGAPSVLQEALYGDMEAPMWPREFQCGGNESALLDCRRSDSARKSCSPGKTVGLTCLEPDDVRLVGGDSRCAGSLELKHEGEWRPVDDLDWTLKAAAVFCKELDCGSAVSIGQREESVRSMWRIRPDCVQSGSALRDCTTTSSSIYILTLTCSDSVRLLNGTSLCSGRLEVRSDQSGQHWSSVCEADFDQQDAEVVCRELGCGAPSVLQEALYGDMEAPVWPREFQCGGNESALLDCRRSDSARKSCSPGKTVGLTCSEPDDVRLVGGDSRCAGSLELKHEGEWKPVENSDWTPKAAAVFCKELDCGSAVSIERKESVRSMWRIRPDCVQSGSALRECTTTSSSFFYNLNLTCSGLLFQPNISVSSSVDGVSEAKQQGLQVFWGSSFTISCSIQPQYPGGFFQLTFTSSTTAYSYHEPAVSHSAHFPFPAADPAHQGTYSCVYHVYVFSHHFSSESGLLSIAVLDPTDFIIRVVIMPLTLLLMITAVLWFCCKACRGQQADRQEDIELAGFPAAEGGTAEEEGAQEAESDLQGDPLTST